jgi:hypothetical protein
MNKTEFIKFLDENNDLKKDLFIRAFLLTDRKLENINEFPFYGNWKTEEHSGYYFMAHQLAGMHVYESGNNSFFIFGHAYNPFTMEIDETVILERIASAYGTEDYIDRINELTGVFVYGSIVDGAVEFFVDPSGMQSAFYGKVENSFYLTSHAQLIGDLCNLEMDGFVKELLAYKWYGRVMGPYLPADLSPFGSVKRIVPSIQYWYKNGEITHKRFWYLTENQIAYDEQEYHKVIKQAGDILHNNMVLISKKWNRPWISLTGGIDSNTTFAAANGIYDKFETFSYISAEKEIPDAAAAKKISEHFGVKRYEFKIPENNSDIKDFEARRELFRHNNGYIAELYDNEMRKKLYLRDNAECDVEVKSWVSETIRAYWYKHYGRKNFPSLSPKLFRNLYKIFILNRGLAHKIDKLFEQYINDFEYEKIPESYPPADMHFNEVTWGSWGGLNITEMRYCFDITFAYNNRKFLDLMFRAPLETRISDQNHLDVKEYLNKELYDMNIRVVNLKETDTRARLLNVIFTINSFLPF